MIYKIKFCSEHKLVHLMDGAPLPNSHPDIVWLVCFFQLQPLAN